MKKKSKVERKSPRPKKAASGALAVGAGSASVRQIYMLDRAKLDRAFDVAVAFHRANTNDPHNVGCAVICALEEMRAIIKSALS